MSAPDRRKKLDRSHPVLSIRRQCVLLSVARSGVYRPPPANDDADLALMRRIPARRVARRTRRQSRRHCRPASGSDGGHLAHLGLSENPVRAATYPL